MPTEKKLIELEIKLSQFEKYLSDLNQVVIEQASDIQFLKNKLQKLEDKNKTSATDTSFQKPPHY